MMRQKPLDDMCWEDMSLEERSALIRGHANGLSIPQLAKLFDLSEAWIMVVLAGQDLTLAAFHPSEGKQHDRR